MPSDKIVEDAIAEFERKERARPWPDFVPQSVRDSVADAAIAELRGLVEVVKNAGNIANGVDQDVKKVRRRR